MIRAGDLSSLAAPLALLWSVGVMIVGGVKNVSKVMEKHI
jgi:hypothetical protein